MLRVYLKRFSNKLKMTSVYRELINNYIVIAFALLLFILFLNAFIVVIFLIPYLIYLYRQSRQVFCIVLWIMTIFAGHFMALKLNYFLKETSEITGVIVDIEGKEKYNKLLIKDGYYKKIVYDYDFTDLQPGNKVQIRGINLEINGQRNENSFDYSKYLQNKNINQVLQSESIKVISSHFNLAKVRYALNKYIIKFPGKSQAFIKAIILGDDSNFSNEFTQGLQVNGISHLFAVSGLHIGLLVIIIQKLLQQLKASEKRITTITLTILSLYLLVTNFAASILRACLLYLGGLLNKKGKFGLKTIDIISLVFIFLLLMNPYYMYNLGFILSFLMAFTIILVSPLIKNYKNHQQVLLISTLAVIVTLPLVINFNHQINLLSPFLNVAYIAIFSTIILPFTLVVVVCPVITSLYEYMLIAFEKVVIFSGEYLNLKVIFPNFTVGQMLIYYLLVIIGIYCFKNIRLKKAATLVFLLFLTIIYFSPVLNITGEVSFLDLANGEAIFVHTPFSECTALIDTGEGRTDEVTDFLLSKGIKKLDYLFLTHNHLDHNGEAATILKNVNVGKIITSNFDNSVYAKLAITKKVATGDKITCGDIIFQVLSPNQKSLDENDNSLVLYAKIGGKGFLLLGDATSQIEAEVASYNLDVDVLKVAHHGSSTATNPILIDKFRPQYAIIQTGRITRFGFPHPQTINTLKSFNVTIYQTNKDYAIKYTYTKKTSSFASLR